MSIIYIPEDKLGEFDYLFKIVVIGETGVGKTNILNRFTKDRFSDEIAPTVGVDFSTQILKLDNQVQAKLQIWDTAGTEKYKAISQVYYKGSHGCLLCYDISRKQSFESLELWYKELKENAPDDIQVLLVGCKCDLKQDRQVSEEEAIEFAKKYKIPFLETSAKNSLNIIQAFQKIAQNMYENLMQHQDRFPQENTQRELIFQSKETQEKSIQNQKNLDKIQDQNIKLNTEQNNNNDQQEPKKKKGCCG